MNVILFDEKGNWTDLLPLSFTRPIADIRIGIMTIREKWSLYLAHDNISYKPADYLSIKFTKTITDDNMFIASNVIPSKALAETIRSIEYGCALFSGERIIAFRGTEEDFEAGKFDTKKEIEEPQMIKMLYDIFLMNEEEMIADYKKITAGRKSQPISKTCTIVGDTERNGMPLIFIEEGASVEGAFLNTNSGPIYIGKDAIIMEGACIRGCFAACEHSQVNMGAKIYGATTLGPYCKVGGELNNVVMFGYSNKAHDGFLGNAVVGEWCNIGAGTNASNLKNDYTEIKLWNYRTHRFLKTGLQFCGLILGDHSKIGINCMLNTATVIGVGVNIHGSGFPRNFVASFLEGGATGYTDVSVAKFFDIAKRMMARRDIILSDTDKEIFESIYSIADNYK